MAENALSSSSQGSLPVKHCNALHPTLQMSEAASCAPVLTTSGARNTGVPTGTFSPPGRSSGAPAMSDILTLPSSVNRRFAGLISLCTTPLECR
eukprot:565534-Rhodomonas_salina.1